MSSRQTFSFFLETILDDSTRKISLRVNLRRCEAAKPRSINQNTIIELLEQRGYGKYFRFDAKISTIVDDLTQRLDALENGSTLYNDGFETPAVAEARDAFAEIKIADDAMQAHIILTPAKGGKQLDLDSCKAILSEGGVKSGIDEQRLFNLLQQARQSESDKNIEMLVARAKLPVRGEDTQFIPLVETANERILKPQLRPDGSIDMRELGNLPTVTVSEKIMRKKKFTLGEPGVDVLGNTIPAEPGDDFDFEVAPGSLVNPENPMELVSEYNGQPNLVHHGMRVDNVVKVKAVDLSTGNLDIDANLLVEGDITECMKVKCTGDITVGGVIESADVEAQGSILVGKGIVGQVPRLHEQESKLSTSVRAGISINAVFSSYSKLEAKKEIHMDEQLLHCDTTSHGTVTIGNKQTVGSQIVGGITRAASSIETDVAGSHVGILTRFDLSGPYQEKQQEIAVFEQDVDEKNNQLSILRNAYSKFVRQKLTAERQLQADKIKNTILHLSQVVAQLDADSQKMREARDLALLQMQVLVKRRVQPRVEVQIGARKFRSQRAMESGIISFVEGEVCFQAEKADKNQ